LRTSADLSLSRKKLKAKFIFVDAKPEIRFIRLRKRGRQGDPKDFHEFLHQDAIEMATFHLNRAKNISDFKVDNSKDPETTEKQLKKIVKKLKI
jgi:dephospho-CoA kinase